MSVQQDTRSDGEREELPHKVERLLVFFLHRFERLIGAPVMSGLIAREHLDVEPYLVPAVTDEIFAARPPEAARSALSR